MEYDPNLTASYLAGKIDEYVKQQGRDTIVGNVSRDKHARWARIPDGNACAFCKMLGSRGFVYHSEEKAGGKGNTYHPHCNCQVAVDFDFLDGKLGGYDPDALLAEYYETGGKFNKPSAYRDYAEETAVKHLIDRQFAGFDTIDSATAYAEKFVDVSAYKSKIDLKGMNIDAANSMMKVLDAVYDSYDVDKLRSIQRMNKRSAQFKNTKAEAAYQWMLSDMYYNSDYVKTQKAMIAHRRESQELMDDVLGMDLDQYIVKNADNKKKADYARALRDTGRATVGSSYYDSSFEELMYAHEAGHMLDDRLFRKVQEFDRRASYEQYAGSISAYATTDVKEYMAESFSAFYAGETEILDPELVAVFRGLMK